ncbi:MAG: response regulator [Rubricella sp.]
MNTAQTFAERVDELAAHLPYLRRYARALTGAQASGDAHAAAALEAIVAEPSLIEGASGRIGLFRAFHSIWASSGAALEDAETDLMAAAYRHLAKLTPNSREALLLNTIEGFSTADIAAIMGISESDAANLVTRARDEMAESVSGKVMIIEDEAIIAMDLEAIVSDLGHRVAGVARTRKAAVEMGRAEEPNLILADIQLADNSSGIDAVNDLLSELGETPVIFITAFPERLLTGERPEPAFLISKPYTEEQVRSAVSQAMFFASTETLSA